MRLIRAFLLLVIGTATLAFAIHNQPQPPASPAENGQPVFPSLAKKLPQATRIEVTGGGKTTTLLRLGTDAAAGWGVGERDSYPADPALLRSLFAGLAELRLLEPRTADPSRYSRLGVARPATQGDAGTRLRVLAANDTVLAEVILGHRSVRARQGMADQLYLRRAGEPQAWLAEGRLDPSTDPLSWLNHSLLDIKAERIARIDISRDGTAITLRRQGDRLVLDNPPAGKLDDVKPVEVAQALEGLSLTDVKSGDLPGTPSGSAQFTTTDGARITVLLSQEGETVWARLAASDADAQTSIRLAHHVFALPSWRLDAIAPRASDFIKQDRPK